MNIDFVMRIRSNGWGSDALKYVDFPNDAEHIVDMLDDLDFDIESVAFEFTATVTYEQMMRFFKLLKKGAAHIFYHGGRTVQPLPSVPQRGEGELYTFGTLCKAQPTGPLNREATKVVFTFEEVVKVKNQTVRGTTILANLGRIANALAWAIRNDVKLSDKPITLRTWNTITLWGENPWKKDEAKEQKLSPEAMADIYAEE